MDIEATHKTEVANSDDGSDLFVKKVFIEIILLEFSKKLVIFIMSEGSVRSESWVL